MPKSNPPGQLGGVLPDALVGCPVLPTEVLADRLDAGTARSEATVPECSSSEVAP